jgi:hypothetical protein
MMGQWLDLERGTVRSVGPAYGFIKSDAGDDSVYLSVADCEAVPKVGDRIEFHLLRQTNGRRRAMHPKVI